MIKCFTCDAVQAATRSPRPNIGENGRWSNRALAIGRIFEGPLMDKVPRRTAICAACPLGRTLLRKHSLTVIIASRAELIAAEFSWREMDNKRTTSNRFSDSCFSCSFSGTFDISQTIVLRGLASTLARGTWPKRVGGGQEEPYRYLKESTQVDGDIKITHSSHILSS
jgi:hypothetical protein